MSHDILTSTPMRDASTLARPHFAVPAGACDSHVHVFGRRGPLSARRPSALHPARRHTCSSSNAMTDCARPRPLRHRAAELLRHRQPLHARRARPGRRARTRRRHGRRTVDRRRARRHARRGVRALAARPVPALGAADRADSHGYIRAQHRAHAPARLARAVLHAGLGGARPDPGAARSRQPTSSSTTWATCWRATASRAPTSTACCARVQDGRGWFKLSGPYRLAKDGNYERLRPLARGHRRRGARARDLGQRLAAHSRWRARHRRTAEPARRLDSRRARRGSGSWSTTRRGCSASEARHMHCIQEARSPPTGARAVETFVHEGERYLVMPQLAADIAGQPAQMTLGDSDIDALVYRWQDGRFVEHAAPRRCPAARTRSSSASASAPSSRPPACAPARARTT